MHLAAVRARINARNDKNRDAAAARKERRQRMTDKKFAFLLMGDYDPIMHQAMFETASKTTCIFTVRDF